MGITVDTSQMCRALGEYQQRALYDMQSQAQTAARNLEAEAKVSAPWSDITGSARGGIRGRADRSGSRITITLSGSVRYMVYLELAHGKRWAILWPTMQRNADRILQSLASFWRG